MRIRGLLSIGLITGLGWGCAQALGFDQNYRLTGSASSGATGGAGATGGTGTTSATGGMGGTGATGGSGGMGGAGATDGGAGGGGGGAPCPDGGALCGTACVDEQSDPMHCGTCTNVCGAPVSGATTGSPSCTAGACDVTCTATTAVDCTVTGGHACVNPKTDPQYCGTCATHCLGGKSCVAGACVVACLPPMILCSGVCVNPTSDPAHCGVCGTVCSTLVRYCSKSQCTLTCATGLTVCAIGNEDACADLQTDPSHCGGCGIACLATQTCVAGKCVPYVFASACWECAGSTMTTCCPITGPAPFLCTSSTVCPP